MEDKNTELVMTVLVFITLVHTAMAYRPHFVGQVQNVTVQDGRDAMITCNIDSLGAYKVAWVRVETQTILTIHRTVITRNPRIRMSHDGELAWKLHIVDVKERDRGYYMCQLNTDPMISQLGFLQVVVAPQISDLGSSSDMVVREGVDVQLRCRATGYPRPRVRWRREDGTSVHRLSRTDGEVMTISRISRLHMGAYLCIARNGILPAVSKRVYIKVHFAPVMLISSQLESGFAGQKNKHLECETEAFPRSINYWTNHNNEMITPGDKYQTETTETALYKVSMRLIIKNLQKEDFHKYKCVAKNSLGEVDGVIALDEIATPRTSNLDHEADTNNQHGWLGENFYWSSRNSGDRVAPFGGPADTDDDGIEVQGDVTLVNIERSSPDSTAETLPHALLLHISAIWAVRAIYM